MDNCVIKRSNHILNDTGSLFVFEGKENIPFVVKRIYYITNVKDREAIRGNHAHKALHQIMVCLGGSCEILLDDGKNREIVQLDDPGKILYIMPCVWREISKFSEGSTLMVLASEEYDEADYIRNYEDFRDYVRGLK